MSIVGQIDDPTEHAAVHLAQREALNDALDLDLDLGVVSLLDDPATHLAVHSEDREALAGAGSSVSQADLGWRLGYAEGHVAVPVSPAAFGTRRVDVARISGGTLSLFRDGAPVGTFDMTGRGPIASTALLKLGQPSDHYSFAAVDRALTDAEIAALDFAA